MRFIIAATALLIAGPAVAADAPPPDYKHLGVATCASSVCHGKLTAQTGRDVALNEYRIWSHDDYHSRAFKDLSNTQSQSIASKLGLASAATAKICLDCHDQDTVIVDNRTKEAWKKTVAKMAERGAEGTDEQFEAIVAYNE